MEIFNFTLKALSSGMDTAILNTQSPLNTNVDICEECTSFHKNNHASYDMFQKILD